MLSKIQFGLILVYLAISFINLLVTRALADVDQRLAPNSYTAEVASTLLWNDYLRKYAKSFVDISPHLTFERKGLSQVKLDTEEILYKSFREG